MNYLYSNFCQFCAETIIQSYPNGLCQCYCYRCFFLGGLVQVLSFDELTVAPRGVRVWGSKNERATKPRGVLVGDDLGGLGPVKNNVGVRMSRQTKPEAAAEHRL